MAPARIPLLAAAADVAAVVVFAAVGRASHDEEGSLLGLLGTVAPFAAGLLVAWAVPVVRAEPAGLRAGVVVLTGTAVLGLALRAAFTGRLPPGFAVVTVASLAVLLLGWRALSAVVSRTVARS
jgi:phage tail tape-measure protein